MKQHALDLQILMEIIIDRGVDVLLEDLKNDPDQDINHLGVCLTKCAETLENDVAQLPAQIIIFLKNHNSPVLQSLVQEAHDYSDSTWLRPRHQMLFRTKTDAWINQDAHNAFIGSIVALPDNERLVTASEDGTIKVWHIDGSLLETLTDHDDAVNSVKLSPDKTRLLAVSDDETGSSRPISTWVPDVTFNGHSDYVSEVAQTTTNRIITTSRDGTACIYDAKTGDCLHTLEGHRAWVYGLAVSPDGTRAITSSINNKMILWDMQSGEEVKCIVGEDARDVHMLGGDVYFAAKNHSEIGHKEAPYEMRWSEDGTHVVSVWKDIIVWDACDDAFVEVMRIGEHDWQIQDLALFDNDTKLITVAHSIKIWDLKTGKELASFFGHESNEIYSVAVMPNEKYFFTGDTNGVLKCWDLNAVLTDTSISGHLSSLRNDIYITQDGTKVLTSGDDKTSIIWDSHTGLPIHRLTAHGHLFVTSFGFIKNDSQCVTTCKGELHVWDVNTGEELQCLKHADTLYGFHGVSFYDNDSRFVCGSACRPMYKVSFDSEHFIEMLGYTEFTDAFAWCRAQRYVLTDSFFSTTDVDTTPTLNTNMEWDESHEYVEPIDLSKFARAPEFKNISPVQLWDVQKGHLIAQYFPPIDGNSNSKVFPQHVMWCRDETQVIGVYSDGRVHVWDRATSDVVYSFQATDDYISACHLIDDDTFVTISNRAPNLRGWHLPTQKTTFELNIASDKFSYAAFNAEGNLVAGVVDDNTICLLDIKTGRVLCSFTNQNEICQMNFDNHMIVFGDEHGVVVSLDLVCGPD